MTLEERADNFIQKNMVNCIQEQVEYFTFAKQSYIASAKENGIQWHDLRKDPNDLPKEDLRPRTLGYYLTASKHKSYKGFVFEVAYFTGVIFTKGGDILDNVIAWKEIKLPELPKEEV